jgi:hypothetical protein
LGIFTVVFLDHDRFGYEDSWDFPGWRQADATFIDRGTVRL